jgi:hypothetical protein
LLDHAIERGRQLADFIGSDDLDRSVKVTGFNLAGPLQQQSDRARNAAAHQDREQQSECGSKGGDNNRNQNCMLLIAQHHRRARIDLTQHVGAYLIELLIEFIANLIRARQRASGFDKILRFKLAQKLSALVGQMPIEVVDRVIDIGVDAGERDIVRRSAGIGDDRGDKLARGVGFFLDLIFGLLINLQPLRVICFIRRVLHFRHGHAA